MKDDLKADIVIATYNRSRLLGETLVNLSNHLKGHSDVGTIIVNNNSSDDTQAVSESFSGQLSSFRTAQELQQGLSYARNHGIQAAAGDIVVFLDDDVEVDENWLDELLTPFSDPDVAVVGGKVLPYGMQEFPDWLPREYGFLASVFDPSDVVCEIDKVMGANFAVRRSVFEKVGLFDVSLGRKGKKLLGGEEVELFHRIRNAGFKIVYTPHSIVWHKISEKLKREYIEDYAYWLGVSEAVIDKNVISQSKHFLKTVRSTIFPWTVYAFQNLLNSGDVASAMRYTIKRNYARGYLSYANEMVNSA